MSSTSSGPAAVTVRVVDASRLPDLEQLFSQDPMVDRCWCMWFITRVVDFHDRGRDGNRAAFEGLLQTEEHPLGLLAYRDDEPVGWSATGPRRRYERMLRSPTLKGRDADEDDTVWLVPCFYIRAGQRRAGVATALLHAAVAAADRAGAAAIEGIPLAGDKTRSSGTDFQTGVEPLFAAVGFQAVRRPSNNRVIMRHDLR